MVARNYYRFDNKQVIIFGVNGPEFVVGLMWEIT